MMDILERIDEELDRLDEAEEVSWDELSKDVQGVLSSMGIKSHMVQPFSGIHGEIVAFKKEYFPFRLNKKDFNKLKNKNIRWLDIKNIGI